MKGFVDCGIDIRIAIYRDIWGMGGSLSERDRGMSRAADRGRWAGCKRFCRRDR